MKRLTDAEIEKAVSRLHWKVDEDAITAIRQLQSENAAIRADVERLKGALGATKADFLAWAEIRGGLGTYRSAIERIDAALGASSPATPRGSIDQDASNGQCAASGDGAENDPMRP